MISCKRAAEWTSRELDAPLGVCRGLALRLHRLVCGDCRRFRTQLAEVDRAAAAFVAAAVPDSARLPDDARERITKALRDAGG